VRVRVPPPGPANFLISIQSIDDSRYLALVLITPMTSEMSANSPASLTYSANARRRPLSASI